MSRNQYEYPAVPLPAELSPELTKIMGLLCPKPRGFDRFIRPGWKPFISYAVTLAAAEETAQSLTITTWFHATDTAGRKTIFRLDDLSSQASVNYGVAPLYYTQGEAIALSERASLAIGQALIDVYTSEAKPVTDE